MRHSSGKFGSLLFAATLATLSWQSASAVETDTHETTAPTQMEAKNSVCPTDGQANVATAQAEHSAEATAHKSLNDPNNQLGTSLQGRTRGAIDCAATASAKISTGTAVE